MNRYLAASVIAVSLVGCGDNIDNTDELEEMIVDLEEEVADLTAQLAQLHEDLTTRTQERDALAGKVTALEGKIAPAVTLEVPLFYGAQALQLGTEYPFGGGSDTISFREVRYWLTNVALQKANGDWAAIPDAYYLVEARGEQPLANGTMADLTLPAKRRETVALQGLPSGDYKGIKFSIGVDADHNNDLSKTAGELHTLKNMAFVSWMWFTSYVFTKTVADLSGGDPDTAEVSWDNGTNADLREVTLAFPSQITMAPGNAYAIKIKADVAELVADVNPSARAVIDAETPAERTVLANAFRDMFTMVAVDPVQ